MKNKLTLFTMAACAAAAMLFTSCGKKDTFSSLADETVAEMNALADAMSTVKDKESAEVAAKKVDEITANLEDIAKRLEALGEPSEDDKNLMMEKLQSAEKGIREKMIQSGDAMRSDPEIAKIIMEAMNKFGERMSELDKTMK